LFGGTADSVAEDATGARVANAVGTVWDGPSAGAAHLTDLTDIAGAPIIQLTADSRGFVAAFYGPDGYERLWVDFGGGRVALVSVTVGERFDSHVSGVDPHGDRAYSDAQLSGHSATASSVHGVTGSVVGTTNTQTLTNKTLNGGTLTGTFAGSHTLTGGVTFTTSAPMSQGATSGTTVFRAAAVGDAADRFQMKGSGLHEWGDGTLARDTNLYRNAVGELKTDTAFTVAGELRPGNLVRASRALASDSQWETRASGDANARWFCRADGQMWWGPGNATQDTNLYRSGLDTLRTDDSFAVGGDLSVSSTTWSTYVPTVTNGGTVTWSQQLGWYKKLGKLVFVEIYLAASAAGSGTTGLTIGLPSTPYRDGGGAATTRQYLGAYCGGVAAGTNSSISGSFSAVVLAGGSGAAIDQFRGPTDIQMRGEQIGSSTIITIQGWYREA
jgi:hypothetical protein